MEDEKKTNIPEEEPITEEPEENGPVIGSEDNTDNTPETGEKEEPEEEPEKSPEEEAAEKVADLTDRLQRQMAEFENFRKRTEKEKAAMFDMGSRNVIEKILPVIDNFERGLAGVPEESREDPFVTGMERVYKQLMTELEALGVKAIEAKGQVFNPDLHNAVMHIEDDTIDENIVVEEFQRGYTYRDSVVRYSMVKVAN